MWRHRFVLGHSVSSAVGWGDIDGQAASGLLDHLQHLHLGLQLQAVAALTLYQGRACSEHPGQPAAEGAQQLRGRRRASVLHREVNPSAGAVHVHVGGTCQLCDKFYFISYFTFRGKTTQQLPSLQIHAPGLQPRPDGCGHQPTLQQQRADDRSHVHPPLNKIKKIDTDQAGHTSL